MRRGAARARAAARQGSSALYRPRSVRLDVGASAALSHREGAHGGSRQGKSALGTRQGAAQPHRGGALLLLTI
eukprot:9102469-Alexandrium_andersonii.AAC.1